MRETFVVLPLTEHASKNIGCRVGFSVALQQSIYIFPVETGHDGYATNGFSLFSGCKLIMGYFEKHLFTYLHKHLEFHGAANTKLHEGSQQVSKNESVEILFL